jgi:AraC-like DNA-binding protein
MGWLLSRVVPRDRSRLAAAAARAEQDRGALVPPSGGGDPGQRLHAVGGARPLVEAIPQPQALLHQVGSPAEVAVAPGRHSQRPLARAITLDDLAGEVGMSRFHFARRFRSAAGTTPHEFLLQQRVKRARTMLERTNTPLPEIARECGFAEQPHLTREFKKPASA